MEPFFISHEEFWDWFNRDISNDPQLMLEANQKASRGPKQRSLSDVRNQQVNSDEGSSVKKMKTTGRRTRSILETEAASGGDVRYLVMFGRHRPGKKNKVWEGDGYLTLVGDTAHLFDLKGKMLEEPTVLDEIDLKSVQDFGELLIGETEVQVEEIDKK